MDPDCEKLDAIRFKFLKKLTETVVSDLVFSCRCNSTYQYSSQISLFYLGSLSEL